VEASHEEFARLCSTVLPHLNEVWRRVVTGSLAVALGNGAKSAVAEASGMNRNTVINAERKVEVGVDPSDHQIAVGGAGSAPSAFSTLSGP